MPTHPPEHPESSDIQTLNVLAQQYGKIPWQDVYSQPFSPLERQAIIRLLPKNPDGSLKDSRPDVRACRYYLYCLKQLGQAHAERYFMAIYRNTLAALPAVQRGLPVSGLVPVFYGMRREQEDLGKSGPRLDNDTAKEFARFLIGLTFRDTDPGKTHTELLRKDFRKILEQFPALKKLARQEHMDEGKIQDAFKAIEPRYIAELILCLRLEITEERRKSNTGGIKYPDVFEARDFLLRLENLLAERIAKAIVEGPAEKIAETAETSAFDMFLNHVGAAKDKIPQVAAHLKTLPKKPREDKPEETAEGKKDLTSILKKAGEIGAIAATVIAIVTQLVEVLGWLKRGKTKQEAAPETAPTDKPKDHPEGEKD